MATALDYFTAVPKRHNCAQAVIEAQGHPELLDEMGCCGGGHAPEGLCGALYAAMQAVPSHRRNALKIAFREELGEVTCKDLKQKGISCRRCVEVADALASTFREASVGKPPASL